MSAVKYLIAQVEKFEAANFMNLKYAFFAILSTAVLIYISALPGQTIWGNDTMSIRILFNLAHIPGYALLSFLWLKCFERGGNINRSPVIGFLILLVLVIFSVSTELYQIFVPGRTASSIDIGLNFVGILSGLTMFHVFKQGKTPITQQTQ